MLKSLQVERDRNVAILTLNNPEKRNAMTLALATEIRDAISAVGREADTRVVVLAANGPVFCAGGDLKMIEDRLEYAPEENRRFMGEFYRAFLSVLYLDVPTIAAIHGHAIGAGLTFTLACDIRLAAEEAKMGVNFINLGLHPGMGTTHLLPLLVGTAHAAEMIFTGKLITGREAAAIGLVNRAIPSGQVREEAMALANEIAAKPANAVRMSKRALARLKLRDLEAALDYEAAAQMANFASVEMRTSLEALHKRQR